MELAQVLDYCKEWNAQHDTGEDNRKTTNKEKKAGRRLMTQAEIDAFLG